MCVCEAVHVSELCVLLNPEIWCQSVCVGPMKLGGPLLKGGIGAVGVLHPFPAGYGEKCSAAEMQSKGGELHGFHDYQVLWRGCGFGSIIA